MTQEDSIRRLCNRMREIRIEALVEHGLETISYPEELHITYSKPLLKRDRNTGVFP